MTGAVEGAWASWWPYRGKPDVVAHEVVGPLAIADLVAVQFDQSALRARASAGIRPLSDYAALAAAFACQRAARRTADLVPLLGLGESSVRRALRLACEAGVVEAVDRGRYRTHRDWSRVGHRLVALELKKAAWQRAAEQVWAYQSWANSAWVVLGQRPPRTAMEALAGSGMGLAYVDEDENVRALLRPKSRRYATSVASAWAAEQALEAAPAVPPYGCPPVKPVRAKWEGATALLAG